jgi:serine/threonine-protein kinase
MDGQLPIKRAATIAIHTLAGLQAAHDRGILHRDLKPANLMLVVRFGDRNFVKVCDFGFAALFAAGRADAKSLTPERTLVGTPAYAAPERLRGDDRRDPRLDVYSVGVVLYEMLAGRRPFDAPTFRELARMVRRDEPAPLREARPDIPRELELVVMRALAKDREKRWPSAEAFGEALFTFGGLRVPFRDEQPSDSFTMEMMRIKARESRHRETHTGPAPKKPEGATGEAERMGAKEALAVIEELEREVLEQQAQEDREREQALRLAEAEAKRHAEQLAKQLEEREREERRRAEEKLEEEAARAEAQARAEAKERAERERENAERRQKAGLISKEAMARGEAKAKRRREAREDTRRSAPPVAEPEPREEEEEIEPDEEATQRGSMPPTAPPKGTLPPARRAARRDETERTDRRGAYNGKVVLAILRFVARKFGERSLKVVLDSMSAETRHPFVHGIDADSWVDLDAVRSLVEAIDAQLGQDDLHLVLETGRAAAEGAFDLMQDVQPPAPPPEVLVAEMPTILQRVFRGIECEVRRVGRGYGRLELLEWSEPSLTVAVGTLGFLARSLERFGADDVEVNLLSARALEDPQTLIDISWFA